MKKIFQKNELVLKLFGNLVVAVTVSVGIKKQTTEWRRVEKVSKHMNELDLSGEYLKVQEAMSYFGEIQKNHEDYPKESYKKDVTRTEACRTQSAFFWRKVKTLEKLDLLPEDFFCDKKPWFSRAKNYLKLIEPIEEYNYYRNEFDRYSGPYCESDNRPEIFNYIQSMPESQVLHRQHQEQQQDEDE